MLYRLIKILLLLSGLLFVQCQPETRFHNGHMHTRAGCTIRINGGLSNPQPLLMLPGTTEFYPYTANGNAVVEIGEAIEFHCMSAGFRAPLAGANAIATCIDGTTFKINGEDHALSTIACTDWPYFTARRTGQSCNGGTKIDVGFQLEHKRFLQQYEVCFDEYEEVTRYVHHSLSAGSMYFATGSERNNFITADFFRGKNVDRLYTRYMHQHTINEALGCTNYFNDQRNIFLTRGHLAAKADFLYAAQQRATYMLINAAPQWQKFNAGNWEKVESGLRNWVTKYNKYIECYTGVWGVSTLPNVNGVHTPLYLAYDANNRGLIPVPKIFFRVVIEPATGKGIVFVGVNNPHLTLAEIQQEYVLCHDVSERITWLNWQKKNIAEGYSYACEVEEFSRVVRNLPKFSVTDILC